MVPFSSMIRTCPDHDPDPDGAYQSDFDIASRNAENSPVHEDTVSQSLSGIGPENGEVTTCI